MVAAIVTFITSCHTFLIVNDEISTTSTIRLLFGELLPLAALLRWIFNPIPPIIKAICNVIMYYCTICAALLGFYYSCYTIISNNSATSINAVIPAGMFLCELFKLFYTKDYENLIIDVAMYIFVNLVFSSNRISVTRPIIWMFSPYALSIFRRSFILQRPAPEIADSFIVVLIWSQTVYLQNRFSIYLGMNRC